MDADLFRSERVRLAAPNAESDAEMFARWSQDAEYLRLLDSEAARPRSAQQAKEMFKEHMEPEEPRPDAFNFVIRTLADDRLIGFVGLDGVRWTHGDAFLGIGIGEREYWDKGYGTDALRLLLRYAFTELNLHRVSLTVFDYNQRAIRAYEKAGFVVEGRMRQVLHRDGRRYDLLFMGLLREEWEKWRT